MREREGDPVHLHGVRIGEVHLNAERQGREVVIKASLKVDWPGLWHAAARSLDKGEDR
jgi:hypothetical protein